MGDNQKNDNLDIIAGHLKLSAEQVATIKAQPSTIKRHEMITDLAVKVISKSQTEGLTLAKAREMIIKLQAEIEKNMTAPFTIAIVAGDVIVGDADHFASVDIHRSGQELRVPISATVDTSELSYGTRVLLSESMVVVKALDTGGHGEVMTIKEVLPSGDRAIVVGPNESERTVHLNASLKDTSLRQGDSLLINTRIDVATEKIAKTEVNDLTLEEVPDISYNDIGGLVEQIEQIRDAVELPYLYRDLYEEYELSPTKGVLLYGPPGCGKTLIAKAIANSLAKKKAEKSNGEIRAYFLNVKGPELLNKYVGETERHIRLIFQRAREKASSGSPVIIFFDEMESMFHTRGSGISSDVEKTIVPQLLAELDGVESLENVLVIGASNRQDLIDPAILRPGRLDIKIRIERPDAVAAMDIFSKYLTESLPVYKPELDEHPSHAAYLSYVIDQTVGHLYATRPETEFLEAFYSDGSSEILHYKDFSSGAMIQNIVDRAKKAAIKEFIESGQIGIRLQYLLDACDEEFKSNEDLPNTTNPDDWAKISGRKGERIINIKPMIHKSDSPMASKPIENTPSTGQYL